VPQQCYHVPPQSEQYLYKWTNINLLSIRILQLHFLLMWKDWCVLQWLYFFLLKTLHICIRTYKKRRKTETPKKSCPSILTICRSPWSYIFNTFTTLEDSFALLRLFVLLSMRVHFCDILSHHHHRSVGCAQSLQRSNHYCLTHWCWHVVME
jgi:hypothetical protein